VMTSSMLSPPSVFATVKARRLDSGVIILAQPKYKLNQVYSTVRSAAK
jgi:hypothetical protein